MQSNKKSGFSLIELMITLVIASFLVITINTVLQQTARSRRFVETRVKDGLFIGTLQEILTYDFSGITMTYELEENASDAKKTEKQIIPPIQVKRGPDNSMQEMRFLSVNAREYKKHDTPTEIVYTIAVTDKTKKTHALTRTVISKETTRQKKEFETPAVKLFDNITQLNIKFLKQKTKDEIKKDDPNPFTLFDEWPLKEKKEEKEQSVQKTEQKQPTQKKELEDISYIQLTIVYIKNDRGAIESITLLIPIFLNKPIQLSEKKEESKKQPPIPGEAPKKVAKKKKKMKEKSKEELALLEERANSMLNLIFKGMSGS